MINGQWSYYIVTNIITSTIILLFSIRRQYRNRGVRKAFMAAAFFTECRRFWLTYYYHTILYRIQKRPISLVHIIYYNVNRGSLTIYFVFFFSWDKTRYVLQQPSSSFPHNFFVPLFSLLTDAKNYLCKRKHYNICQHVYYNIIVWNWETASCVNIDEIRNRKVFLLLLLSSSYIAYSTGLAEIYK